MTDLASVLAAPPKKKAVVDPNVKAIRKLARLGWAKGRTDREVIVRPHGDEVWMTDTYGMRRWHGDDPVAVALMSTVPEGVDASDGFTLSIGATTVPRFVNTRTVDMAHVMVTTTDGRLAVHDWRAVDGSDSEVFASVTMDGETVDVLLDRKRVAMVTDGANDVRAWCDPERPDCRPVAFTSGSSVTPFAILMPFRKR